MALETTGEPDHDESERDPLEHPAPPSAGDAGPPRGLGAYRTPAKPPPEKPPLPVPPILIAAAILLVLGVVISLLPSPAAREQAQLADAPAMLLDGLTQFPPLEADLPPSTPLAPLLVADAPAELALLSPQEGATRVVRGETLHLRFNRPMVRSPEVGRPLEVAPIVFTPPVAGTFRWTTRSSLVFTPDVRAFDRNQEAAIGFADGLASLDGETLYDDVPRVLVLDGSPRFLQHRSSVAQGEPLTMLFDAQVSASELGGEMFAWEVQGRRPIPLRISGGAFLPVENEDEAPRFEVQMTPGRMLEAGAHIAVAIAPRWDRYGGSYPRVVQFALAPRPRVTGIGCEESRWGSSRCTFTEDPGQIVDIGPSLRLLASERLGAITSADVRVSPPLRGLEIALAGTDAELERVIAIGGEWEPDQVYEVRLGALRTATGERVVPLAALAVRSRGHHPSVEAPVGSFAYERGAPITMRIRGIHTGAGRAIVRPVPEGREVDALLSPASFAAQETPITVPLATLLPDARPNRWGRGALDVRSVAGDAQMMVVAFQPSERAGAGELSASFVQSTDLGVTAEALERGLLVWVSSIARAAPVANARVELRSAQGRVVAEARTDAIGAAWLRSDGLRGSTVDWAPLAEASVIVVRTDDDRAVLALDPRRAVGPATLGLTQSGVTDEEDSPLRATVIADRGAYRPGEPMHVLAIARRVQGAHARAPEDGDVTFRVMSSASEEPIAEARVRMEGGRADTDWTLNEGIPLGTHRVELVAADGAVLGTTSITVAEFRQPRFRVDLAAPEGDVHARDALSIAASARYLFGAPLEGAAMRWSIAREGRASFPARWSEYAFGPAGGGGRQATLAEGEATLDATGAATLGVEIALAQAVRTRIRVEAEVTDGTGQTTAATRNLIAYPAAFEVGVRQPRAWTELGSTLPIEAIAIDHAGEAIAGEALEARVVREGWHGWFEWHGGAEEDEGSFQQRRDQRREVVHTCRLTSAAEPARCDFTPTRGGTYVLEIEGRDDAGRTTLAQARVYVAGPDEHPDRDPPGAPIALTPSREEWSVGESAQLAFESPWDDAEALITVHHGSLLSMERRRVGAGGQVIDVPLTDAMVPNVFVTVALIRGRSGEPSERIDLHAPDLRFGSTSVQVRPRTSRLEVAIETEAAARPGSRVPVTVRVRDEEGRPVRGADVALWAVDEGTLRMTGYATPDPTRGLFVDRGAAFALEDLRRALVSRIDPTIEAEASGDGGYGDEGPMNLEERERFDPTPLWAPRLVTDREGGATATLVLPDRPTEYRIMAIAVDAGLRRGRAGTAIVAEQPLVVRAAFPRFATEGDRFEAVAFVHNAGETDIEAQVRFRVGGRERDARTVSIRAGGEARVSEPVSVGAGALLEIGVEASATVDGEATMHAATSRVPVVPAARWVRRRAVVGGAGERGLELAFAADGARASRGELRVAVASHPFVGLDGQLDALEESWWGGTEVESSRLLALSSYLRMSEGLRRDGRDEVELRARAERALERLLRARTIDGGFGRWSAADGAQPYETVLALRALIEAEAAGLRVPAGVREQGLRLLERLVLGGSFGETYGRSGQESWALALRLLGESGTRGPGIDALYEQREFASPAALAWLALALPEGDLRRDTALALAVHRLFPELEIPGLVKSTESSPAAYVEHDVRALSAVLEATSRADSGRRWMAHVASELLRATAGRTGGLGGPLEIAQTMAALSACAERFGAPGALQASLAIDDSEVAARVSGEQGSLFEVPWSQVAQGSHQLLAQAGAEEPLFVALDARWAVPIGEAEEVARGRGVSLHRVIETAAGTPLADGAHVPLGTMVRVRLFVHLEGAAPDRVAVRDPLGAGFESVDTGLRTTPHASLMALLGASPEDDSMDPRGFHAMRTLSHVEHRTLDVHATTFYLSQLPPGLHELTYAVRATTPGTFVLPPAAIEALRDDDFVARTTATTLVVDP